MNTKPKPWWQTIFDDRYRKIYCDILSPEESKKQIDFVVKTVAPAPGAAILDLACGFGRHAIALAKQGFSVTGVDLSQPNIDEARMAAADAEVDATFLCQDIRSIDYDENFDCVINLFSSFGYFDDEAEHPKLLQKIARSLRPGGFVFLDLRNHFGLMREMCKSGAVDAKTGLFTNFRETALSNGLHVTFKDECVPERMRWRMTPMWEEDGQKCQYTFDMRIFTLPEIHTMLGASGLHIQYVWGDFNGSDYAFDSPRMMLKAKKV